MWDIIRRKTERWGPPKNLCYFQHTPACMCNPKRQFYHHRKLLLLYNGSGEGMHHSASQGVAAPRRGYVWMIFGVAGSNVALCGMVKIFRWKVKRKTNASRRKVEQHNRFTKNQRSVWSRKINKLLWTVLAANRSVVKTLIKSLFDMPTSPPP